jgi:hypothetical protein
MSAYDASHFLSRELSWLEFNQRVLHEALNPANPIFERVKFFAITSSNLDEFFEVRVAGLKQAIQSGVTERSVDGRTPLETFPDRFLNEDGTLLVCSTHGARFRVEDGLCVTGPCAGKALKRVPAHVINEMIVVEA